MDDQLDKEGGPMEDLSLLESGEARVQVSLEVDGGEELLDEDQACKRGEGLALESSGMAWALLRVWDRLHFMADLLVLCLG